MLMWDWTVARESHRDSMAYRLPRREDGCLRRPFRLIWTQSVHLVNSDAAENGKLKQVLSSRGSVCLRCVSRCFLAQPSHPANRNPGPPSSTQRASALGQTPTFERGRPL